MKNLFLLTLGLTFFASGLFAQLPVSTSPQNKKAVLEEFTGINCTWCPAGHVIANQIYAADPNNVLIINIHSGSFANAGTGQPDFKTTVGTAIDQMPGMGITGYPAGTMNRMVLSGTAMAGSRSLWNGWANTVKSQPAYCNVALQGTIDPQTRVLTVQVEVYYTANSPVGTNSLNVFLLEDKIPGPQINGSNVNLGNYNADGTYNHNHVLRKALTPNFGLTIPNTIAGTLFTTTLTYTIPTTYGAAGKTTVPKFGNLELVGFVTQTDRTIINGDDGPVSMTNDAAALAVNLPEFTCGNSVSPIVTVENTGLTPITSMTLTPAIDGVVANTTSWNGNLAAGATTTIALNPITTAIGGGHTLTYTITGVSGNDFYTLNNSASTNFYLATGYSGNPIVEPFTANVFPPALWGRVNSNAGPSWTRVFNTGAYAINPFGCMKYDFFSNTVMNDVDEMLLPPLDLTGTDTPTLSFDIAKAFRSTENDQLEVLVSTDCGVNWISVFSKAGTALAVWPTAIASNYIPSSAAEWRTETVPLPGFNTTGVLVKFVTTNNNGNNMFIDNINLSQTSPATGVNQYGSINYLVNLYPNPSNGETKVDVNAIVSENATLMVVNALGQVVYQSEKQLVSGSNEFSFDASQFAGGIYSVIVASEHASVVKKLTVTK